MMIKHIDHINIVVSNLESARQFFLELGFIVQREGPVSGKWIEELSGLENINAYYIGMQIPDSQTNIELLHFESPESGKDEGIAKLNQIGMRHLAFRVDNLEQTVDTFKMKGIRFISDIHSYEASNKKLCYFKGPDGIILELAEYK